MSNEPEIVCQCSKSGFCERRQVVIPNVHWRKCQSGLVEHIDQLYRISVPQVVSTPRVTTVPYNSRIGEFLAEIIKKETGASIPCGDCKKDLLKLNTLTPAKVISEIEYWMNRIYERSQSLALPWYQSLVARYAPAVVRPMIKSWIQKAVSMSQNSSVKSTMRWAYGITTVPSRVSTLFPQTLNSLLNAGFDAPKLFIDNCSPAEAVRLYSDYSLPFTSRTGIRTAGNWVLSIYELYIQSPDAERYAIFQDDFVAVKNLRRFLELTQYPEKGYQNLYTFPSNEGLNKQKTVGWYPSNQLGRVAVALVFSNEALRLLLGHPYLVNRFQDLKRGHKAIDGGIVETMKRLDWKEYVHFPSLVQHTGAVSSMGSPKHPLSQSFPGENFDALDLLKSI